MKKIFFLLLTIITFTLLSGCSSTDKLEQFYNNLQENLNYQAKIILVLEDEREMHSTIYLDDKIAKAEVQTFLPDKTSSPVITSYFEQPLGQHVYEITYNEQTDEWIKRFSGETKMIGTLDPEIFDPLNFSKNSNNKYTLKSEFKTYFGFSNLTIEFQLGKVTAIGGTLYQSQPAVLSYTFTNIGKTKVELPDYVEAEK